MTATHHTPKKYMAIIALIFLLPALYIFSIWLKVWKGDYLNRPRQVSAFLDHFPGQVQNLNGINYFTLACCLIAIILATKSFKQSHLSLRLITLFTVLGGILILLMTIFQMI